MAASSVVTSAAEELRGENVHVHFAGVKAVDGVDVVLRRGEILGLIGPNGAGKTTLVNALSGFERPSGGQVFIDDVDVTEWAPHRLAHKGLTRTFQGVRVFAELTALENVELGALGGGGARRDAKARARELLERLNLSDKADQKAMALSYGDERRIGLLRALAMRPTFLLLDEPAAGLNETESDDLMAAIADLHDEYGFGALVIEHDMRVIMRLCERIQVLNYGKTIRIGSPADVQSDPAVLTAYLGTKRGSGVARERQLRDGDDVPGESL